jgi:phosphatidylserine decarboxylase
MTEPTQPSVTVPPLRPGRSGARLTRLLVDELTRRSGPTTALLYGAEAGSPVLAAALRGLAPEDRLTVVPDPGDLAAPAAVRAQVADQGRWVEERVRVATSTVDGGPADVVIVAQPLSGAAGEAAKTLAELAELVAPGGVLVAAAALLPGNGAAAELADLAARNGVGSDLVLRAVPPVRVYRLRFSPAPAAAAERLAPAYRPSSVPVARGMHLDSNGVAAAAICLGLAAVTRRVRPSSRLWLVPALAAVPVAAFFRDPRRVGPEDPAAVVAASDGTVLSVETVTDGKFGVGDGTWLRIAVFLSVLDVHVNRAPVAGRVTEVFRETGGYAPAMKPAAEHNVAAYTVLDTADHGPVVVAQRTGLVARRIVHRAPAGALLARGERFGLIRFGSRTDVYLPAGTAESLVAPGDKVSGGATVIARWR